MMKIPDEFMKMDPQSGSEGPRRGSVDTNTVFKVSLFFDHFVHLF